LHTYGFLDPTWAKEEREKQVYPALKLHTYGSLSADGGKKKREAKLRVMAYPRSRVNFSAEIRSADFGNWKAQSDPRFTFFAA